MNKRTQTVASVASRSSPPTAGMSPYAAPEYAEHVDLRLDANEGPRPEVDLGELVRQLTPEVLRRYPSSAQVESALADRWNVARDRVIVTSGGDDAIDRVCRACLGPGSEVILPTPTFEMIQRYANLTGAQVQTVPWWREAYPTQAVLDRVSTRTRQIVVVSPHNPTRAGARREDLLTHAERAPQAVLLVDAAYGEFADEDLTMAALSLSRAVAVRTLAKAYGLAGLRVGYAIGPADLVRSMRAVGAPYPVSGLSLALAAEQLQSAKVRVLRTVDRVRLERGRLDNLLSGLGASPLPSQANFVLAEFDDAAWVWSALRSLGIATRKFTDGTRLASCLRITCPAEEPGFARLAAALEAVLRPAALLLDMDGVLADVSGSYRSAMVQTAAAFGARISAEEVGTAKLVGGSNNDWIVTKRLLAERGIDVPLETVAAKFNQLYRGDNGSPGLEVTERLIPSRALLERLARRLPLAIVTGRPRRDADAFLDRFELRGLFKAVVSMEDAPAKPSPAPVELALQKLDVHSAWMIGDTPDDLRLPRAAGVVPLGIAAPSDDASEVGRHLAAAGSARVLESLDALEEILT